MSDITRAVIGMPYDLAMSSELSRRQFHGRAQTLLDDCEALIAENVQLRAEVKQLCATTQSALADPPMIPIKLEGLADAAFTMAERGEDPSDVLAMIQAGLKKLQPKWDEQKTRTVNSMCMTWRHDFGLDKRDDHFGSSGMTDDERETLRAQMGQLFDHHIAPEIAKNERLQQQVVTLQSAPTSWQSAYDKGRADGTRTRLSELEQERQISAGLRAENEQLRAERDAIAKSQRYGEDSVAIAAEREQLRVEVERLHDALLMIRNHTSVTAHQIATIDAALGKGAGNV